MDTAVRRMLLMIFHPDGTGRRRCQALTKAWSAGATAAGQAVRRADIVRLDLPLPRGRRDGTDLPVAESLVPPPLTREG
jgi:hypothetical protein